MQAEACGNAILGVVFPPPQRGHPPPRTLTEKEAAAVQEV